MKHTIKEVKDLDTLLDEWTVIPPSMWANVYGPLGWYAVSNDNGIIAYFGDESDACAFRLDKINTELNRK